MENKLAKLVNENETKLNNTLLQNNRYLKLTEDVSYAKKYQKKVYKDYWLLLHYSKYPN